MNLRAMNIFLQKLNEIQNRLPVKLDILQDKLQEATQQQAVPQFKSFLDSSMNSQAVDKEGNDRSADLQRAMLSRENSPAVIPLDKTELMSSINDSITNASQKYNVDANLIRSVIKQESGYNPYALSRSGAQGLMQLMPGTADGLGVTDPWDISQNIDGGTQYLRDQLKAFNGDVSLALAAYNAGPNSVRKYDGIPPYSETQNYVTKVLQYYNSYSG